jgi:hypothetical protein
MPSPMPLVDPVTTADLERSVITFSSFRSI